MTADVSRETPGDPVREALEAMWQWWAGGEDPGHEWDPRESDGCWPNSCDCGMVAVFEQARTALAPAEPVPFYCLDCNVVLSIAESDTEGVKAHLDADLARG